MKFILSSLLAFSAIGFAFGDETCTKGAELVKKHVGQKYTQDIGTQTHVKTIRVVHPGDPVTMDHLPTRLNVYVTGANIIEKAYCG